MKRADGPFTAILEEVYEPARCPRSRELFLGRKYALPDYRAAAAYPAGKQCRTMEITPTGRRPL
jgi:hypothetical protein